MHKQPLNPLGVSGSGQTSRGTCTHPNDTDFVDTLAELDKSHTECRQSQDCASESTLKPPKPENLLFEGGSEGVKDLGFIPGTGEL